MQDRNEVFDDSMAPFGEKILVELKSNQMNI